MKNAPVKTDTNPGNISKSGKTQPTPGTRANDAARGVKHRPPTIIAASNDPQGGPAKVIRGGVRKAGDKPPTRR
jgi:hypothetical protein